MEKADKDILTTARTAKLLGVSVRTAQLLIEGGSVPSWKTPGGHRRVYRADVEALIEGHASDVPPPSATVVVVAGAARLPLYDRLFREVPECTAELFEHVHAALFAIGSVWPYAVLVDLDDGDSARLELLQSLAANPSLGHSRLLASEKPGQSYIPSSPTGSSMSMLLRRRSRGYGPLRRGWKFGRSVDRHAISARVERGAETGGAGTLGPAGHRARGALRSGHLARRPNSRCAHRAHHPAHVDAAMVQGTPRARPAGNASQLGLLQLHHPAEGRLLGRRSGKRSPLHRQSGRCG